VPGDIQGASQNADRNYATWRRKHESTGRKGEGILEREGEDLGSTELVLLNRPTPVGAKEGKREKLDKCTCREVWE